MPLSDEDRAELVGIVREALAEAAADPPDSPAELEADAAAVVAEVEHEVADEGAGNDGGSGDELVGGGEDPAGVVSAVDDAGLGVIPDVPDVAGVVPVVVDEAPVRSHPYWRGFKVPGRS